MPNHSFDFKKVNIIIGNNGSGKSFLLREECLEAVSKGKHVLAIAQSVHDRFLGIRAGNYKFFGARQGRSAAKRVFQSAFLNSKTEKDEGKIFSNLLKVLTYTGFDPQIGIRIPGLELSRVEQVSRLDLPIGDIELIHYSLLRCYSLLEYTRKNILLFSSRYREPNEPDLVSIATIIANEAILKKSKIISGVQFFLKRNGTEIPLLNACSGEILFIATMAFIASNIDQNTLILIDEPENSLHPQWQKDYVESLLDLFNYYSPQILISTHSPLIISGGAVKEDVEVYRIDRGNLTPFHYSNFGLEEMYEILFGVVTPKNRYLSQKIVQILNRIGSGDTKSSEAISELEYLENLSYDDVQKKVIQEVKGLAAGTTTY